MMQRLEEQLVVLGFRSAPGVFPEHKKRVLLIRITYLRRHRQLSKSAGFP